MCCRTAVCLLSLSTLCQDVPLHDADGGPVLVVAAGGRARGLDQQAVGARRAALQRLLALPEQLLWVHGGQLLLRVLQHVGLGLGRAAAAEGLRQGAEQPAAAAAPHRTHWWAQKRRGPVKRG